MPNGIHHAQNDSGVDLTAQADEGQAQPAQPLANGDSSNRADWVYVTNSGRGASPASSIHSNNYMQEEPESIKVWREQQQKLIKEKGEFLPLTSVRSGSDEAEEKQKSELREQAKKELEAWHRQRERDVVERKKKNR